MGEINIGMILVQTAFLKDPTLRVGLVEIGRTTVSYPADGGLISNKATFVAL